MGNENPVAKLDPDTCVDFSTHGNLVSDKYRENYDKIFRKQEEEKSEDKDTVDG